MLFLFNLLIADSIFFLFECIKCNGFAKIMSEMTIGLTFNDKFHVMNDSHNNLDLAKKRR